MTQETINALITTLCSGAILGVLIMWRDVALLKQKAEAQEKALGEIKVSLAAIPTIQTSIAKMEGHIETIGATMQNFMETCVARRSESGRRGDD